MRLYFLRHGQAADRETWTGPEAERPLTQAGRDEMRLVADGLVLLDLGVDLVVSSPLARAVETAQITAQALGAPLVEAKELASGATLGGLLRVVRAHEDARRMLLVGHEPDFSQMIGELIASPHPASLTLKKAGCARVDLPRRAVRRVVAANDLFGVGTLAWLLTPRQLIRIGGHVPLVPRTPEHEDEHHA